MPRLNGMGPQGLGPQTGRRMGQCTTGERMNWCGRRMMGRGNFYSTLSVQDQLTALELEEKSLLNEIENIKAEKEALKNQQ